MRLEPGEAPYWISPELLPRGPGRGPVGARRAPRASTTATRRTCPTGCPALRIAACRRPSSPWPGALEQPGGASGIRACAPPRSGHDDRQPRVRPRARGATWTGRTTPGVGRRPPHSRRGVGRTGRRGGAAARPIRPPRSPGCERPATPGLLQRPAPARGRWAGSSRGTASGPTTPAHPSRLFSLGPTAAAHAAGLLRMSAKRLRWTSGARGSPSSQVFPDQTLPGRPGSKSVTGPQYPHAGGPLARAGTALPDVVDEADVGGLVAERFRAVGARRSAVGAEPSAARDEVVALDQVVPHRLEVAVAGQGSRAAGVGWDVGRVAGDGVVPDDSPLGHPDP